MKIFLIIALLVLICGGKVSAAYENEIAKWRKDAETRLRSETGWLSVVGLEWLKPGANSIGSAEGQAVRLPKSMPAKLGTIQLDGEKASIQFSEVKDITVAGKAAEAGKSYPLALDSSDAATEVKSGGVLFFLIKRPNGIGVRVKDADSELRREFKGRTWFSADPKFVFEARWHELEEPKKLRVPDIKGNIKDEEAPGYVTFTVDGREHTLYPIKDDGKFFFVFRDETSGKETYGAGRFLYADPPTPGAKLKTVNLDFNKAVNPPCAFTAFATCPVPPPENRLQAKISAGEKTPARTH